MKIFMLSDYPQKPSGLSILGSSFYYGLAARGHEICVEAFWKSNIKDIIKSFNPDIVLSVGFWGWSPQLIDLPKSLGYKVVPFFVPNGKVPVYMDIMQKADILVVPSEITKTIYVRDGFPEDRVRLVHLGLDPKAFTPNAKWGQLEYSRKLLTPFKEPILFSFWAGESPVEADGNVPDDWRLIQALPLIKKSVDKFCMMFKVYGNAAHLPKMWKMAAELGVKDNLKTLDIMFPYEALQNMYNAFCDIHVSIPTLSGFEIHRIEAMACGKPSIGGNWSPDNEIILNGETGYTVKSEITTNRSEIGPDHMPYRGIHYNLEPLNYFSINDYVEKIIRLLKNENERRRMGEAARKRVQEHFNIKIQSEKLEKVLNECL